jgi:hypothetical protein
VLGELLLLVDECLVLDVAARRPVQQVRLPFQLCDLLRQLAGAWLVCSRDGAAGCGHDGS